MATATHLSLEEFHRLYDGAKPNYEYWFGEAIQKPMATNLHGALQFFIMVFLRAHGWMVASEARLKLVPDAEPVPDVIASREVLPKLYSTKGVGICIEILSPDDRLKKTIDKGKHYLAWGVPKRLDHRTSNAHGVDADARTSGRHLGSPGRKPDGRRTPKCRSRKFR